MTNILKNKSKPNIYNYRRIIQKSYSNPKEGICSLSGGKHKQTNENQIYFAITLRDHDVKRIVLYTAAHV